jgi:hypothetical protein
MKKNNEEFSVAELQKVMGEITELLEKSEGMYKDDEEDGMPEEGAPAGPEGGMPPEGQPAPGPEASPEGMPEEGSSPEDGMPPEGDAGHEGQESDSEESMEELIHSMSEEQLQMMLQAIQAALASKGQEGAPSPEGQPAPAPGPEGLGKSDDKDEDDLKKSKEDAHKPAVSKEKEAKDVTPKGQKPDNDLKKSIDSLVGVVGQLAKDVAELKAPKAAPAAKVVSKLPKTSTQIQVLEKSVKVAERLSKSETIEFLHNQIRQGNRLITKRDISDVSYANSNEAMAKVQDGMVQRGIVKEFPKK